MKISLTADVPSIRKFSDALNNCSYHTEAIGSELGLETSEVEITQNDGETIIKLTLRPKQVEHEFFESLPAERQAEIRERADTAPAGVDF